LFGPHYVQDVDTARFLPIENPTRWFNNLAIPPTPQLRWLGAAFRMVGELVYTAKDALHELTGGFRIL
jgi:hypothetical protein